MTRGAKALTRDIDAAVNVLSRFYGGHTLYLYHRSVSLHRTLRPLLLRLKLLSCCYRCCRGVRRSFEYLDWRDTSTGGTRFVAWEHGTDIVESLKGMLYMTTYMSVDYGPQARRSIWYAIHIPARTPCQCSPYSSQYMDSYDRK